VLNHGGTVKGIAMMTKERSKVLPDVPTGIEQGVPNLEAYTWNAIFLSKEASAEMVNKLNRATVEAMESPNVSERLEGLGAVIVPPVRATPEYPAHCAQRDREMDGADQGKRGDRGVSRIVFAGLVRESRYAEFDRQLSVPALWGCARPCGRWTTPARAMAAAGCSIVTKTRESSRSSISLTSLTAS
jgi:Tripartite tricarboxylate transporter family receptor